MTLEQDLFASHQNVAHNVAKSFVKRRPRLFPMREEITQAALCGLWNASRRYDAKRGRAFSVFASYRCKGAILDYLRSVWGHESQANYQKRFENEYVSLDAHMRSCQLPHATASEPAAPAKPDRLLLVDQVCWFLRVLPPRDAQILTDYYIGGLTMREVAARAGISETRISQLIPDLLRRVRDAACERRTCRAKESTQ